MRSFGLQLIYFLRSHRCPKHKQKVPDSPLKITALVFVKPLHRDFSTNPLEAPKFLGNPQACPRSDWLCNCLILWMSWERCACGAWGKTLAATPPLSRDLSQTLHTLAHITVRRVHRGYPQRGWGQYPENTLKLPFSWFSGCFFLSPLRVSPLDPSNTGASKTNDESNSLRIKIYICWDRTRTWAMAI